MFKLGLTPLNLYDLALKLKMGKTVASTTRSRRNWVFDMLRRYFISFDDVDWSKTIAYSVGNVGPIFVNLAGREPEGCVASENYEATLEEISHRLKAIVDPETGESLVTEIHFGKDIYSGKQAPSGPDIMIFMRNSRVCAYGNTEFASNRWLTPSERTGWHRMHGVLIASGPGIKQGGPVEGCRLWDIYPTIMAVMGLPLPRDLDGRVLDAVVTQEVLDNVRYGDKSVDDYFQAGGVGYSEEEEALIAEHLKGLGYV